MFSKLAGLAVLELDWLIPVERWLSRGSEDCRPSLYSQANGKPDIFDTDQGSQFTGSAFTSVCRGSGFAPLVRPGNDTRPRADRLAVRSVLKAEDRANRRLLIDLHRCLMSARLPAGLARSYSSCSSEGQKEDPD